MIHWQALARAVRHNLPTCRVAVVDGPAMLLGTRMVLGPFGELEEDEPAVLTPQEAPLWEARGQLAAIARQAIADGRPRLHTVGEFRIYADPVLAPPRLIVAGAGHVAYHLAPAAVAAGFRVTVVDDRPECALPERFPGCTVLCQDMAEAIAELHPDATTFVVLAGRSHSLDKLALKAAVQQPSAYLGMVGSRRKVSTLTHELLEAGESTLWAMEQLRAPIGLDIGAETPAEIAVSIVGELIAARRGGSGVPLSKSSRAPSEVSVPAGTMEAQLVWLALAEALDAGTRCALATVVSVRGSTPRSAGACMLIRADGSLAGTVGGGKWEAEVQRIALETLTTGQPVLLAPKYMDDNDMICGGNAEIFIEPVGGRRRP